MTRAVYDATGGLYDRGIVGSGDNIMAFACIGECGRAAHPATSAAYRASIRAWQRRVPPGTRIGYVPGVLHHFYHGKKTNRKYMDRWRILAEHAYDPAVHVQARPEDGLLVPSARCPPQLLLDLQAYFQERDEDDGMPSDIRRTELSSCAPGTLA